MGNCVRRGQRTPRPTNRARDLDQGVCALKLLERHTRLFPNTDPLVELFEATSFEFWKDWIEIQTPRQRFRLTVKRVIFHLNSRKRWAYRGHILAQLEDEVRYDRPSPQALFHTPLGEKVLVRRNGELQRKLFHSWDEQQGRWIEIPRPGSPGGSELKPPWTFRSAQARPSGRRLARTSDDPPQSTIPRKDAINIQAESRKRPQRRNN